MKQRKLPCGCVEHTDKNGRESINLCPTCKQEADERHEAARISCSHVYRDQVPQ